MKSNTMKYLNRTNKTSQLVAGRQNFATNETATTKHIIFTLTWPCSDSRPLGQSSGNIYRRTLANFCPSWFRSNHSSWSSPTADSDPFFTPLHDAIL